ncbi:MAG: hypothetical protein PHH28_06855 [Desulfuromonadaceae bacterium]|nr:hypothetical protein [Desulfuromonadaceae bacterium]
MKPTKAIIYLLVAFFALCPVAVHAFWWSGDDTQSGLNLETGYDINTVTMITGRIISVQTGNGHRNAQLELENNGTRVVVILGPQRYWAENGISLKSGDYVTIRGSKAQGTNGVVYILAQKITDTTQETEVSLRNESGRPAWAGGGMRNSAGQMNTRTSPMHQQSPGRMGGRMGGGRMGR